jgi:hypothetical protein
LGGKGGTKTDTEHSHEGNHDYTEGEQRMQGAKLEIMQYVQALRGVPLSTAFTKQA